jgi:hypothetical protein
VARLLVMVMVNGGRGAFGAGWDGEENAVVGSSVTGVGGQGGAQVGGKDGGINKETPHILGPRSGVNKYRNPSHLCRGDAV